MNIVLKVYVNPLISKNCNNFVIINSEIFHISRKKRTVSGKFNVFITLSFNGQHKYIYAQNYKNITEKKVYKLNIKYNKIINSEKYLYNLEKYLKRW